MNSQFSTAKYLDFHTHSQRHSEREDVLEIVSLHLGQTKSYQYFTVGLHPWWTTEIVTDNQRHELTSLLSNPHCLAMGEMGLDNLKGPDLSIQMDILRSQLSIAAEQKKPVIIHCVRAMDQLLQVKKEFPSITKWCIHGYGRNTTLAMQLIKQGFYLSLMPINQPGKYKTYFDALPHDRLFLETDSMPDQSIEEIYLQISREAGIPLESLCKQMNKNAIEFFNE